MAAAVTDSAATSSTKRTKYDYLCSICIEPMRNRDRDSAFTDCHHFFHTQCIIPWVQRTATCPLCRTVVPHLYDLSTTCVTCTRDGEHDQRARAFLWKWFNSVQPSTDTSVEVQGLIDETMELQLSILQLGAVINDIPMMQLGLDLGVDINANGATFTPLCLAAYKTGAGTDVAEFLLEHKADIDRKTSPTKCSVLSIAVQHEDKKLALFLLEHGASACVLDDNGLSPLHHCARESSATMCEMLLRFPTSAAAIDIQAINGSTALTSACSSGNVNLVRLLLEKKADPDRGLSILYCSKFADVECYRALVAAKADVNCQHPITMETALHLVMARTGGCDSRRNRIVEFLLDSKANVNLENVDGFTPLLCEQDCLPDDLYFKFVAAGAGVVGRQKGRGGWSLLHIYAAEGRERVCRSLLELKASVYAVNSNDSTPLHRAAQCAAGFDVCKLLCESGAPVDSRDKFGFTPLSDAITAMPSSLDICRLLIAHRANVNYIVPFHGKSLLYIAIRRDLAELCELLILSNADLSLGLNGKTAIQTALTVELDQKPLYRSGDCLRLLLHHSPPLSRISNLSLAGASTKSGSHNHVRSDSTGMADLLFKNTSPQFRMRYVREKFDE